MIEAVTGYPGSGKSFYLTYRAFMALKKKKLVFSSFYIKGAYRLTFEDLVLYTFPKGSTVIIDESGRWFNARKWASLPSEVFDLFTLHRHMELDMLVAVQNFQRIDIALREVIELVWWARNYWFLPVFVYDGYYDVDKLGMKGEANTKTYVNRWTKARKLYDTHAMSKAVNKDEIPLLSWDDFINEKGEQSLDQGNDNDTENRTIIDQGSQECSDLADEIDVIIDKDRL